MHLNYKLPGTSLMAVVLVYFLTSSALGFQHEKNDATHSRRFVFRYGATLTDLPVGSKLKIWLPIATSNKQQNVELTEISVPASIRFANDSTYGNRMGRMELAVPTTGQVSFEIIYAVTRSEAIRYDVDHGLSIAERETLLSANRLVPISGRPLELIAHKKRQTDDAQTGREIYDAVLDHLNYDKSIPGFGNGDVLWACDSRTGNCTDFHSLFISLMRSRDIPAQFEIGFSIPTEERGSINGYHCWAWFFANNNHWGPVDISEADKHPELKDYYFGKLSADRITISTGRDIPLIDQPETKLNYFVYPYVEVDGTPLPNQNIQLDFSYENF